MRRFSLLLTALLAGCAAAPPASKTGLPADAEPGPAAAAPAAPPAPAPLDRPEAPAPPPAPGSTRLIKIALFTSSAADAAGQVKSNLTVLISESMAARRGTLREPLMLLNPNPPFQATVEDEILADLVEDMRRRGYFEMPDATGFKPEDVLSPDARASILSVDVFDPATGKASSHRLVSSVHLRPKDAFAKELAALHAMAANVLALANDAAASHTEIRKDPPPGDFFGPKPK